jgi:hypothetical protein
MGATEKISITLGRDELRGAKRLAAQLGLSLSTFVSDAVKRRLEAQARAEAGLEVLRTFPPEDRATPAEMRALLAHWGADESRTVAVERRPRSRSSR